MSHPTPPAVIARVLEVAALESSLSVLDSRAGSGELVQAVRSSVERVIALEPEMRAFETLSERAQTSPSNVRTLRADFMEWHNRHTGDDSTFDRVLMCSLPEAEHVQAAFEHVAPGGRLVAIMREEPFYRNDSNSRGFRAWLEVVGGFSDRSPTESFTAAGVTLAARLVLIDKPAACREATQLRLF